MSLENEFDKSIADKMGDIHFPFDDANWQKASQLIDVNRMLLVKAGLKKFYLYSGIAALILVSSIFTMVYFNDLIPSKNLTAIRKDYSTHLEMSKTHGFNSDEVLNVNDQKIVSNSSTALPKIISTDVINTIESKSKVLTFNKNGNNSLTPLFTNEEKLDIPEKNNIISAEEKNNVVLVSSEKIINNEHETIQTTNEVLNTNSNSISEINNIHLPFENSKIGELPNTESKTNSSLPINEDILTNNSISEDNEKTTSNQFIPLAIKAINFQTEEKVINIKPLNTILNYDDYYQKGKSIKKHYLNLEAGAAYLLGWQTKQGIDAKGINAFAGLNYGAYISKKMSLSIGLQAYNINNIKESFYKNTRTSYSFGSSSTNTVITCNALYYAAIPFKINYILNQNNKIGLGINFGYVLNSKNTIETYGLMDNQKINYVTETNHKIYESINSTNFQLSLFYSVKLSKRFGVNIEALYGLTDIFIGKKLINKNNEMPTGFRLGLTYTLFDK
jgi:hypothetical protein